MLAVDRIVAVHQARSPCQAPAPYGTSHFNDSWKDTSTSTVVQESQTHKDIEAPWDLIEPPASPEPNRTQPIIPQDELDYDMEAFPEHAYLFKSEANGTWLTSSLRVIRDPSAESFNSLRFHAEEPQKKLEALADSASDELKRQVDHSLDGHDLTEIHGRFLERIPKISLPDMRQVHQAVDKACDKAQSLIKDRSNSDFACEITDGGRWAFAWTMGRKARNALVTQKICHEWQVMTTRKNIAWQDAMNQQLSASFRIMIEQENFTSEELFKMEPNWRPSTDKKSWKLRLSTGYVTISKGRDDFHSFVRPVYLNVDFKLPEDFMAT